MSSSAMMTVNEECPICMEKFESNKNITITECGHHFHTSCLMTSVAHNGFSCPYCRNIMAKAVIKVDDDDDDDEEDEEYEENLNSSLRGLRFFINNLTNEPHDIADIEEEEEKMQEIIEEEKEEKEEEEKEEINIQNAINIITSKLKEQGVNMEDLVKSLLIYHDEYEDNNGIQLCEGQIYGKFRIIINNLEPL